MSLADQQDSNHHHLKQRALSKLCLLQNPESAGSWDPEKGGLLNAAPRISRRLDAPFGRSESGTVTQALESTAMDLLCCVYMCIRIVKNGVHGGGGLRVESGCSANISEVAHESRVSVPSGSLLRCPPFAIRRHRPWRPEERRRIRDASSSFVIARSL